MHTTLSRSLALLISMFALTSSFSLSTGSTRNEEDAWIVEVVESKDPNSSIGYTVKGNKTQENKQKPSAFYKKVMKYDGIAKFINELGGKLDSTFVLYKLKSQNVIVGVISKDYEGEGYKLHLFKANWHQQYANPKKPYVLDETNVPFVSLKKIEGTGKGDLKLYLNVQGGEIIEVEAILEQGGEIHSFVKLLPDNTPNTTNNSNEKPPIVIKKNTNSNENVRILVYIISSIVLLAALYVIYKSEGSNNNKTPKQEVRVLIYIIIVTMVRIGYILNVVVDIFVFINCCRYFYDLV